MKCTRNTKHHRGNAKRSSSEYLEKRGDGWPSMTPTAITILVLGIPAPDYY